VTLVLNYKSSKTNDRFEEMNDFIASQLAKQGLGNPYLEKVQSKLFGESGLPKSDFIDVEKAFIYEKDNLDAINIFVTIKLSQLNSYRIRNEKIRNEKEYLHKLESILIENIKRFPEDFNLHNALAMVYDYLGLYDESRAQYHKIEKLGITEAWRLPLALSYMQTSEYDKALYQLRNVIKAKIFHRLTYLYLGEVHNALGDYKASIKYLKLAKSLGANKFEIEKFLQDSYLNSYHFIHTIECNMKLLLYSSYHLNIRNVLHYFSFSIFLIFVFIQFHIGKFILFIGSKLPIIKHIENKFISLDMFENAKAEKLFNLKLYNKSITIYRRAASKCPLRYSNYYNLAICYLLINNLKQAEMYLDSSKLLGLKSDILINQYNQIKKDIFGSS